MDSAFYHLRARQMRQQEIEVDEIRRRAQQWRLTDCSEASLEKMRRSLLAEMDRIQAQLDETDQHFLVFVENGRPLDTEKTLQRIDRLSKEWEALNDHLQQVDEAILERHLRRRLVNLLGSEWLANLLEAIVFILIVVLVVLTIVELSAPLPDEWVVFILNVDTVCSLLLLGDFFLRLSLAEDKRWYLRRYWIDLVASLPFVPILHFGRLVTITRFARMLRLLRLGRALRVLLFTFRGLDKLFRTFQLNLLKRAIITAVLLLFFGAVSISFLESAQARALADIDESLWWSFTTVVTGGFADLHNPTTTTGRLVTVGLVLLGLTVTGIFTASLTSVLVEDESSRMEQTQQRMRADLAFLHQKLDLLSGETNEGLIALETVAQALSNQTERQAVGQTLADVLVRQFECVQASVHLLGADRQLQRIAHGGPPKLALPKLTPVGEGFIGRVTADLLARPDLIAFDIEPVTEPAVELQGIRLACPLVAGGQVQGVLHLILPDGLGRVYLYNRVPMTLAHHAAMAFYAADLREKVAANGEVS